MTSISYEQLQQEVINKRVLVFGGFSGMEYENKSLLEKTIKHRLEKEVQQVGKESVAIICGATTDGIGCVYAIAKELGLATYGIVSQLANKYGTDRYCDKTFFVDDPENTWKVISPQGHSYMVEIARDNGVLIYYGGGEVAVSEISEALSKNIAVEVDISFAPDAAKTAAKIAKNPQADATPLATYMRNKYL